MTKRATDDLVQQQPAGTPYMSGTPTQISLLEGVHLFFRC
jgi:hypothetical protein